MQSEFIWSNYTQPPHKYSIPVCSSLGFFSRLSIGRLQENFRMIFSAALVDRK